MVVDTVLPGARWRAVPANHPYTRHGRQLDVETSIGWVELAECGPGRPRTSWPRPAWTRSAAAAWRWAWGWIAP